MYQTSHYYPGNDRLIGPAFPFFLGGLGGLLAAPLLMRPYPYYQSYPYYPPYPYYQPYPYYRPYRPY